jgi:hypothetical protein
MRAEFGVAATETGSQTTHRISFHRSSHTCGNTVAFQPQPLRAPGREHVGSSGRRPAGDRRFGRIRVRFLQFAAGHLL